MPTTPRDRTLPAPESAGPLLPWLLQALAPMNRTRVKKLLVRGEVHINGTSITRHDHPLKSGDRVTLGNAKKQKSINIVYEDESVIVIDKPAGLLTVATESEKEDTAFRRLVEVLPQRPFVVHRLDRETSGLLMFARSASIRDRLQAEWNQISKTYLAIVEGRPLQTEGRIENHLRESRSLKVRAFPKPVDGAKPAVSRYRVLSSSHIYSLIEVNLETGRKHQIRVHLAGLGCPIIGDSLYGAARNPAKRLGLHAHRLEFKHPDSGRRIVVESPLPAVLARIV